MATSKVYRPNVDYTMATEVTVATSPVNSKTAFIPAVQTVTASGGIGPATGTTTSVDSTASPVTLLAANTSRQGATITNTDANTLYVLLGTGTVSATNFTVAIAANGYFEVPFKFTGAITGIWAVDGSGAAKITEVT